ncbi:MAG: helix-turn-helix domain-containing protein [Oleispira sp.]|nr:helix-turn-helix domain-containing protein [Oleispira sp.]
MINIYVLGFDQALASAITGIVDLFALAGVTWNRIQGEKTAMAFNVQLASDQGKNIQCINNLLLAPNCSFSDLDSYLDSDLKSALNSEPSSTQQSNILIVPTIGGPIQQALDNNPELIQLLRKASKAGWTIAGNCTGNFLLAEAGILNGKSATTHWGFETEFKQRFPQVNLQADQLITRDENIFCAGGGIAWFDLGLHIIERSIDFETAMQTAKAFVLDYRRDSQLSYSLMRIAKPHQDDLVNKIQAVIEQDCTISLSIDELATQYNVSQRTLIRRFNSALGMPPNTYLQSVRIEHARKMLEESDFNIDTVMNKIGYEDASSFRRLFKKRTGLTPTEYRNRFSRRL